MKKFASFLAVCFALTAFAQDKAAMAKVAEQIFKVNADSEFATPVYVTSKDFPTESFDVACNSLTFRFGLPEPPNPIYAGQPFIVRGYIYPGGTFAENDNNGGINADGTAQWPDLVLGLWTCRGWAVNPTAVTIQTFDFGDDQLVTDSHEPIDPTQVNIRPTTGGTRAYSHVRGDCNQWVVGTNLTGAPNFAFQFIYQGDIQFKK